MPRPGDKYDETANMRATQNTPASSAPTPDVSGAGSSMVSPESGTANMRAEYKTPPNSVPAQATTGQSGMPGTLKFREVLP